MFTFDEYGVSGHINHIATYHGVNHAYLAIRANQSLMAFKLKSKNILRKFLGLLEFPLALCLDEHIVFSLQLLKSIAGMQAHVSQNLFYRQVFIALSSFTYINSFVSMEE